jgi:hypothetical protein
VATLAADKRLPIDFLGKLEIRNRPGGGVLIPYFGVDGVKLFARVRDAPHRPRFEQPKGVPLFPYGLNRLGDARQWGHLYLTEGESDAWTLWACNLPALGLPGCGAAKALERGHLADIQDLYVLPDNDPAGESFFDGVRDQLQALGFTGRAWRLRVPEAHKDINAWWTAAPDRFAAELRDAVPQAQRLESATPKLPAAPARTTRIARQLPAYQPFPFDALPPTQREYVDASAGAIGCDPAFVAPHSLAAVAGAIGNSRAIRLKRGWSEPAVIWAVTVAPSGRLKSPGYDKAIGPLLDIQMALVDDHEEKAEKRNAWENLSKLYFCNDT